jgi:hypothetical protein
MQVRFTDSSAWSSGYYGIDIGYPPGDVASARRAFVACWHRRDVEGCYLARNVEPSEQQRIAAEDIDIQKHWEVFGVARRGDGIEIPCGSFIIVEPGAELTDLLTHVMFYVSLGSLQEIDPSLSSLQEIHPSPRSRGPAPLSPEAQETLRRWDRWFADIGHSVWRGAPFLGAVVGHEVHWLGPDSAFGTARGYLAPSAGGVTFAETR